MLVRTVKCYSELIYVRGGRLRAGRSGSSSELFGKDVNWRNQTALLHKASHLTSLYVLLMSSSQMTTFRENAGPSLSEDTVTHLRIRFETRGRQNDHLPKLLYRPSLKGL
jgi:hypothetical protein